jgi:hypothetical protein
MGDEPFRKDHEEISFNITPKDLGLTGGLGEKKLIF